MTVEELLAMLDDPAVKKKIVKIVEEDSCRRRDEAQAIFDDVLDQADIACYGTYGGEG